MFLGKKNIVIIATIVLLLIISGCVSTTPEKTTPMPTSTPIPGSLPSDVPPYTQAHNPEQPSLQIPTVNVTSYPVNVVAGTNFTIEFEVSGGTKQGNISHVAVHWGTMRGGADIKDYGRFSKVYTGRVPQQFSTELIAPESGIIYFRVHALIDGADIYSDEYEIRINPP
ncbi:MAG: hypothetical protein Q7J35_14260 [Candidatus Methanoperedens sp.]|nr:hypothetical protein [Candidatus Methanoperedens sp.]